MKIKLEKYGPIISDKDIGSELFTIIKAELNSKDLIEIDFINIISMATFCAKQIFGRLYIELGSEVFFEKIKFHNVSDDLQIIIKMGIQNAIEENSK